ncbi:MAG: DinB family protein [Anaerolineales bacterium]|nr:DinB family protein [Anaerolineales bacterium]MCB9127879.1 DinB family protein [Ardenticatenales bacterium]MCB9171641.1 DinB family protein [Ardenticatenales bacterium]
MSDAAINNEKLRLIAALRREREAFLALLKEVDERRVVYAESGWRIQDVLSHLAAWEREALATIQAHSEGDEGPRAAPLDGAAFNEAVFARTQGHFAEQARIAWGMARRDLQFAIHEIPAERFAEEVDYPWGERGSISGLVDALLAHEAEHMAAVRAVLQG